MNCHHATHHHHDGSASCNHHGVDVTPAASDLAAHELVANAHAGSHHGPGHHGQVAFSGWEYSRGIGGSPGTYYEVLPDGTYTGNSMSA